MAVPTTYKTIPVRSPYLIQIPGNAGDQTRIEIRIWSIGESEPTNATFQLSKVIPISLVAEAVYNISPYLSERIINNNIGSANTNINSEEYKFCSVKTYLNENFIEKTYYTAFNGYAEYTDGVNYDFTNNVLMNEGEYIELLGGTFGSVPYIHFDDGLTYEVRYTSLLTGASVTPLLSVLDVARFTTVHPSYATEGNKVEFLIDGVVVWTSIFTVECEPTCEPLACDFVNRFGLWQRIWMLKKNVRSLEVKNEEFKFFNESVNYNPNLGNKRVMNKNGHESIRANTGFVTESYADVMKQLYLSERVQLEGKDVIVKQKSITYKSSLNDKMMNYELEFMYAFDSINTGV